MKVSMIWAAVSLEQDHLDLLNRKLSVNTTVAIIRIMVMGLLGLKLQFLKGILSLENRTMMMISIKRT